MMEKIDITNTGVVESIRNKMNVATVNDNGLMPKGLMGGTIEGNSILLFESRALAITGSILLSVSRTSSGMPDLYFIAISRAGGSVDNPTLKVKLISGNYNIKIKAKTDADGTCRVYAERLIYTPILNVLMMNTYGITLKMETADNNAFEGGFEATLE